MISVRQMRDEDVDQSATILLSSFGEVYRQRGHVPPFPNADSASWLCRAYMDLDPAGCAVAEAAGALVGVGFIHPRGSVASVGPLAARVGAPSGVGRALMSHLTAAAPGARSLRLFQDAFNPDSFGLYSNLGYVVRDVAPYLLASDVRAAPEPVAGVRMIRPEDLPRLGEFDERHGGADRRRDLALLSATGSALVLERRRAIEGFLFLRTLPARAIVGPGVATSEDAMCALLDAASQSLPGRAAVMRASASSPVVLKRAFDRGFRVDHLGNLMVSGTIQLPPSQLYALFPESL
jgi:hypothetical protein